MRVSIVHGIRGSEIDDALPGRYRGLTDTAARRSKALTVLVFPDSNVVTSSDVARTLRRLKSKRAETVAFMRDVTVEALAALRSAGIRAFTVGFYGWTDERYATIRQPRSHERDRGPGGW